MTMPAWQVVNWPLVVTTLDGLSHSLGRLQHLGTSVHPVTRYSEPRQGQALWGTETNGRWIGIAWDWMEARDNVVAIADPMNVLSNVLIVDQRGAPLDDSLRLACLNQAIHETNWQAQVASTYRARRVSERLAA